VTVGSVVGVAPAVEAAPKAAVGVSDGGTGVRVAAASGVEVVGPTTARGVIVAAGADVGGGVLVDTSVGAKVAVGTSVGVADGI